MTTPTPDTLLRQLRATTHADDTKRFTELLANAARWTLLVGGALMLPGLLVAVGVAR